MEKCKCYHEYENLSGTRSVCYGTKECEPCSCGGDRAKCNFYPEYRKHTCTSYRESDGWCTERTGPCWCPVEGDRSQCSFDDSVDTGVGVLDAIQSLNTAAMWLTAQHDGKTYFTGDMAYAADTGLYDWCDRSTWPMKAFDTFDELMKYEWKEFKPMTRAEAEAKLGVTIID